MDGERSIVEYFAEHERYRCGYCGQSDTNYSHGMWAHAMTVQDYQDLLDRGWRRSGKYTYKPTMNMTCCPQHTIRCEVLNFKISKSQKKVIKKVNRYLIHGIKSGDTKDIEDGGKSKAENQSSEVVNQSSDASNNNQLDTDMKCGEVTIDNTDTSGNQSAKQEQKTPKPVAGPDPSKPPCKKAKELRKEMRLEKLRKKESEGTLQPSTSADSNMGRRKSGQVEGKTLEELLAEPEKAEKCAHKLEIRLMRSFPKSEEFQDSLLESHSVYHRYQMAIHKDPPDKPNIKQYTRFLVDSSLQIRLVQTHPKSEAFRYSYEESYQVYRKYQMTIHKEKPEDCSKHGYGDFLVQSPLEPKTIEGGLPMGYGSFHQQYILDGKIICVGVIDILPSLVSSKYLYYDPDYHFLSLGTYSALREVAFVRDLHRYSADMIYYYMGFYIHSCPKMKYKGQYFPSFLLCPETYTWHPVEKCSPILDVKKYSRFADEGVEDKNGNTELDKVLILHRGSAMPYFIYKALNENAGDEEEVREYAGFAGKTCAERMLLFRK